MVPALAVLVVAALVAGRALVSRVSSPEGLSDRLESALGTPVSIDEVSVSLLRMAASVRGFSMGGSLTVSSAAADLSLGSLVSGDWGFRGAKISDPVYVLPSSADEAEVFARALLIPVWVAVRSDSVFLTGGRVLGSGREGELARGVEGVLVRAPAEAGLESIEVRVEGETRRFGDAGFSATCLVSDTADSVEIEGALLSLAGHELRGEATLSAKGRPAARVRLSLESFYGGAADISMELAPGASGVALKAHIRLSDCDGAALIREGLGLELFKSGRLSGRFEVEGEVGHLPGAVGDAVEVEGEIEVGNAVVDPEGPLAELIPLPAEGLKVDRAVAQVLVCRTGETAVDMTLDSAGTTWEASGAVAGSGSLSGTLVGRIPSAVIASEGAAAAIVAGLLADHEGRIPACFSVGGSLENPSVEFDLECTAEEAAKSGRPEARQLVKAMSRTERERLGRKIDELLWDYAGR